MTTILLTAVVAVVVAASRRVAVSAVLALTLLALVAANGSVTSVKEHFLSARWGALAAGGIVLLPELRRLDRRGLRATGVLALLPLLGVVSAAWSIDPRLTLERSVSFGALLLLVTAAAARLGRDLNERDLAVDVFALTGLVVLVLSLLEIAVNPARGELNGQWRGVFENPNGLGLFLGLLTPFGVLAARRRWRLPGAAVVVAGVVVITVLSQSRSGLLAVLVALVVPAVARRRVAPYAIAATLVVLAAVAVAAAVVSRDSSAPSGPVISTVAPGSHSSKSPQSFVGRLTGARSEAWRASARLIADRPILGYGFGTGDRVFASRPTEARFQYFQGDNPNNGYVQAGLELGLLAGLLFLAPLGLAAVAAFRVLLAEPATTARGAFAAMFAAGLAVALVESVFTSAGAPWELLIWTSAALVLPLLRASLEPVATLTSRTPLPRHRRSLILAAAVGLVVAASAIAAVELLKTPAPTDPRAAATALARRSCGAQGCTVREVSPVQGTIWWARLGSPGRPDRCYVVDVAQFDPESPRLSGAVRAGCKPLPVARPHRLTVAVLGSAPPYFVPPVTNPTGLEATLVRDLALALRVGVVSWFETTQAHLPQRADFMVHATYRGYSPPAGYLPYLGIPEELVARAGTPAASARTRAEIARERLGVVTAEDEFTARRLGASGVQRMSSLDVALGALRDGRVDALMLNLGSATGALAEADDLAGVVRFSPHFFYALRFQAGSALEPLVRSEIDRMRADGSLAAIQRQIGHVAPLPVIRLGP